MERNKEKGKVMQPNIITFDIETHPLELDENMSRLLDYKIRNVPEEDKEKKKLEYMFHEPQFAKVISIAVIYYNASTEEITETVFYSRDNEKEIVEKFIQYISRFKGRFVHYNGLDFDVPFLLYKCALYEIEPNSRFSNLIRFRNDPHYDLMQVLSSWGKFKIRLAEALVSFGIKNSKDVLEDRYVLDFLREGSDEDIKKYNLEDVRSTFQLYQSVSKVYQ